MGAVINPPPARLLFASYHCYLDPSSGAAQSLRDLFSLLGSGGWPCRVFCGPQLDFAGHLPIGRFLRDPRFPIVNECRITETIHVSATSPFSRFDVVHKGIPVTLFDTPDARPGRPPTGEEGAAFLALLEQHMDQFRPDLLLTYGGSWIARETIDRARRRGVPVVFWLRNLAYLEADLLQQATCCLVPSRFAQEHYRRTLGVETTAIPSPLDWSRVRTAVEGRYVTFVNPEPDKGVFLFAGIAQELSRLRRDIPLLVVEGRGTAGSLAQTGIDFDALDNLHLMANTPDPRDFYRVSKALLAPSLVPETFGRVAAEALINGIPVLASRRGGLIEVLADAGFLFPIPDSYTPQMRVLPPAEAVMPWVETIIRLWDDESFHAAESHRSLNAAQAWRPEKITARYEEFFERVLLSAKS